MSVEIQMDKGRNILYQVPDLVNTAFLFFLRKRICSVGGLLGVSASLAFFVGGNGTGICMVPNLVNIAFLFLLGKRICRVGGLLGVSASLTFFVGGNGTSIFWELDKPPESRNPL